MWNVLRRFLSQIVVRNQNRFWTRVTLTQSKYPDIYRLAFFIYINGGANEDFNRYTGRLDE